MTDEFVVSRDSFLQSLGLANLAADVTSPQQMDALYMLTIEYAKANNLIVSEVDDREDAHLAELSLRLPGTAFVLRLAQPNKDELAGLLSIAMLALASVPLTDKPAGLLVAAVVALKQRVQKLQAQYGELTIYEVLAKARPPQIRQVVLAIHGKPCRHPDARCQFMGDDGNCNISGDDATATVDNLIKKGLVHKRNAVEPFEYGIVL